MLKTTNDAKIIDVTQFRPNDVSVVYLDNVNSSKYFFEFRANSNGLLVFGTYTPQNGFYRNFGYRCSTGDTFSVKRDGNMMIIFCNTDRQGSSRTSFPFAISTDVSLDFNFGSSPYIMGPQFGYDNVSVPVMDVSPYTMNGSTTEVDPVKLACACGYSEDSYLAFLITAHTKTGDRKDSIPLNLFKAFATRECISTIKDLRELLRKWDSEIRNGTNNDMSVALFKEIFFAGKMSDELQNNKELEKGIAIDLIKLVPTNWRHFDDYIRFLEGLDRKTISFAEFVYHPNLYQLYESYDEYSPSAPELIDEFAEWQRSQ